MTEERAVLAGGSHVDVRGRPLNALGRDTSGNGSVVGDGDGTFAGGRSRHGRHFVRARQADFDVGTEGEASDREHRYCEHRFLVVDHDSPLNGHYGLELSGDMNSAVRSGAPDY